MSGLIVGWPANDSPVGGLPVSFSNLLSWSGLRASSASDIVSRYNPVLKDVTSDLKQHPRECRETILSPPASQSLGSHSHFTDAPPAALRRSVNQRARWQDVASELWAGLCVSLEQQRPLCFPTSCWSTSKRRARYKSEPVYKILACIIIQNIKIEILEGLEKIFLKKGY